MQADEGSPSCKNGYAKFRFPPPPRGGSSELRSTRTPRIEPTKSTAGVQQKKFAAYLGNVNLGVAASFLSVIDHGRSATAGRCRDGRLGIEGDMGR